MTKKCYIINILQAEMPQIQSTTLHMGHLSSLEKLTCGDFPAKLSYVASCTFCDTFKVECPVSVTKSEFSFI